MPPIDIGIAKTPLFLKNLAFEGGLAQDGPSSPILLLYFGTHATLLDMKWRRVSKDRVPGDSHFGYLGPVLLYLGPVLT